MSDSERDRFDVASHLERVRACARDWKGYPLATATPKNQRYPLVYPRDTAVILRAFQGLRDHEHVSDKELETMLRGGADFLVLTQREDGTWGQRYDLDGTDRSIYPQEDNTAHALAVIARHVAFHRARDGASPIEDACFRALERGVTGAARLKSKALGLYESTTSVHESRIERGFTLWVNGAFVDAFARAANAARDAGRDALADAWTRERAALVDAITRHLVRDGRFVRRLTRDHSPDERADMTLLAPWYFGFRDAAPDAEAAGVAVMEEHLVDPDLHLLRRYPASTQDLGAHAHGGHGPYLSFSSWWAQRAASVGDKEAARERVHRIARYATRDGDLPEHVATMEQFEAFMRDEFLTGLDFRKEFDPEVLIEGTGWLPVLKEADRMTESYAKAVEAAHEAGDGVIRLADPHAWTHADFAYALALVS